GNGRLTIASSSGANGRSMLHTRCQSGPSALPSSAIALSSASVKVAIAPSCSGIEFYARERKRHLPGDRITNLGAHGRRRSTETVGWGTPNLGTKLAGRHIRIRHLLQAEGDRRFHRLAELLVGDDLRTSVVNLFRLTARLGIKNAPNAAENVGYGFWVSVGE